MSSRDCHRTEPCEENVATTQAEYLAVALDKAEEGFDEPTPAFEHATDMLLVRNAYAGGEAVAHLV